MVTFSHADAYNLLYFFALHCKKRKRKYWMWKCCDYNWPLDFSQQFINFGVGDLRWWIYVDTRIYRRLRVAYWFIYEEIILWKTIHRFCFWTQSSKVPRMITQWKVWLVVIAHGSYGTSCKKTNIKWYLNKWK